MKLIKRLLTHMILAGAATVLAQSAAFPQDLHLVGTLDNKHGESSPGSGIYYSATWGYVGPGGREYALLTTATGTAIIEITDTADIHEVVHIPGPQSLWREVRTHKDRAYVVTEAGGGTQIIDLSGLPDTATLVQSFIYTSGPRNTNRAHSIEIFDGYMYLNGCAEWGSSAQRGAVIFDLADPDNPAYVGEYAPNYFHDSYVRNDTIFGASIFNTGGIYIADITNKSAPVPIDTIKYDGSGTHNVWLTKGGRYLISTDEIGATEKNLKFWDLDTLPPGPTVPTSTYTVNPSAIGHNVFVRGDFAYAAWYTAGIAVVDVTNPAVPATAGHDDTSTEPDGNYDGVWAVYPFFWSGKVIAGDMQNGLFVYTFDSLFARTPTTLIEPADSATVISAAPLTFTWTRVADPDKDPHKYKVVIEGDSYDTSFSVGSDTSVVFNGVGDMGGGYFDWFVLAEDEANSVSSPDTFTILKPTIQVVGPNGGEHLKIGATAGIDWSALCDSVELAFSIDGGSSWTAIAQVPCEPAHYDWNVPDDPTLDGLVRISNTLDSSVLDVSDAEFVIYAAAVPVVEGWNLVSAPSDILDNSIGANFPGTSANLYGYAGGYTAADSVEPGAGYWSKESAPGVYYSVGYTVVTDTIPVAAGWNILGSVTEPVDIGQVTPVGVTLGDFFGYDPMTGYFTADTIDPGAGYWVRSSLAGSVIMTSSPLAVPRTARRHEPRDRLVFSKGDGAVRTIHVAGPGEAVAETPPSPPAGDFDVRFSGVDIVTVRGGGAALSVRVEWGGAESGLRNGYRLTPLTGGAPGNAEGARLGSLDRSGGYCEIGAAPVAIRDGDYMLERTGPVEMPASYALRQNYPNPFNPATMIAYDLPEETRVTVAVYNMLGEKVVALVDAVQGAGNRSVEFDAAGLPSGVYFYRITAGSFSETKKMLLAR